MAEYQSLTIDQDQSYPARHEAIPQALFARLEETAGVMLKNPDLCIFRRFDKLHLINLVNIQDRLTQMEKDLTEQVEKTPREDLEDRLISLGKLLKEYGTLERLTARCGNAPVLTKIDDAIRLYAQNADFLPPQKPALRLLESKLQVHNQKLRTGIGHEMSNFTFMSLIPSQAGLLQNFIDTHHSIRRFFDPVCMSHGTFLILRLIAFQETDWKSELVAGEIFALKSAVCRADNHYFCILLCATLPRFSLNLRGEPSRTLGAGARLRHGCFFLYGRLFNGS